MYGTDILSGINFQTIKEVKAIWYYSYFRPTMANFENGPFEYIKYHSLLHSFADSHTHTQIRSWATDFSSIPTLSIHVDWLSFALSLSLSLVLLPPVSMLLYMNFTRSLPSIVFTLSLSAHNTNWNRRFFTVNPFARLLRIEICIWRCFATLPSLLYSCFFPARALLVRWFSTELIPVVTNHS